LPTEPAWAGKRVNYGKDRCAYVPKSQQPQTAAAAHAQAVVQQAGLSPLGMTFSPFSPLTSTFGGIPNVYGDPNNPANFALATANRTVYLGNIHPETSIEEMCNTIRGGALQSIRYLGDKHIAVSTLVHVKGGCHTQFRVFLWFSSLLSLIPPLPFRFSTSRL
jgi:hypothetical protein